MKFITKERKFNEQMDRWEESVEVAPREKCKVCKKNERRDCSAYCQDCSNKYKKQ